MPSTPRRRTAALLALTGLGLLALMVLAAGCGGGHASAPGTKKGAGGIRYQWPPTDVAGPPSQALLCRLLVDDYQHLKTLSAASSNADRTRVIDDFVGFTPTLIAAAPPDVAADVRSYVTAEGAVLAAAVKAGFNLLTFDRSTLTTLRSAPVQAASARLATYSQQRCHYDLSANAALAPPAA